MTTRKDVFLGYTDKGNNKYRIRVKAEAEGTILYFIKKMKDNLKKTGITVIPNDEEKYHKTFRMKSFYKENCKKPYLVYVDLYVPADEFNFSKKAIKVLFEFDGEIIINETEEKILMAV